MPNLEFSHQYSYPSGTPGIALPVILMSGREKATFLAFVDTGATNCVFQRQHGELLDLRIEEGQPTTFSTALGPVAAFGHEVEIEVLGLRVDSMVYFFADERVKKNLLGRIGWLDRVRFGLVEHDHEVYLARYDFDARS